MAASTNKALTAYLNALWSYHEGMSKPSEVSHEVMEEIRMVEKVIENIEGLRREKGWISPLTS